MNLHTLPAQILTKVTPGSLAVASVRNTAATLMWKFCPIQYFGHSYFYVMVNN